MQVPPVTLNAVAPAPPSPAAHTSTAPAPTSPPVPDSFSVLKLAPLQPPTKASAQSVIEAQIEDTAPQKAAETAEAESATDQALEKMAEDAARTKSILGLLPTEPSQVAKLMSALASATSAEAIAKIQLDASAKPELDAAAA